VTEQAAHKKHAARVRANRSEPATKLVTVTGHARQAVYLARQEARTLGHGCVETGHLLPGLLRQRESPAASALSSLGIAVSALREEVKNALGEREPARVGTRERAAAVEERLMRALVKAR
jgi:ATP-dependent Clp protease ATP-binding subunit ClpA